VNGQGKHPSGRRTSWWQRMVPKRWRSSAPDATDCFGPGSYFAEAQVQTRLRGEWADHANLPPMPAAGQVMSVPPLHL
jgi:hypothetical protein